MGNRVLLIGWYGRDNLGDEAILAGLVAELRRQDSRVEITARSFNAADTARRHGVKAVCANIIEPPFRWWGPRTWAAAARESAAALRADVVALGGGGLLVDCAPGSVYNYLLPIRIAQMLRRRTGAIAVSAEHLVEKDSIEMTRETLNRMDFLSVRDGKSAEVLKSIGVERDMPLVSDPALLLPSPGDAPPAGTGPILYVPCAYRGPAGGLDAWARNCDELIAALAALDTASVTVVAFSPTEKAFIDEHLRRGADRRVVFHPSIADPREAAGLVAGSRVVVGEKLHSLILAAAAGVPFVALSYMDKVEEFARTIGCGDFVIRSRHGLWGEETSPPRPSQVAAAAGEAMRTADDVRAACRARVRELKKALSMEVAHAVRTGPASSGAHADGGGRL
jgi:polysaccharide pyruvyl transferase CsaB